MTARRAAALVAGGAPHLVVRRAAAEAAGRCRARPHPTRPTRSRRRRQPVAASPPSALKSASAVRSVDAASAAACWRASPRPPRSTWKRPRPSVRRSSCSARADGDATLLLPRDRRVPRARTPRAGARGRHRRAAGPSRSAIDAHRLRAATRRDPSASRALGDDWRVIPDAARALPAPRAPGRSLASGLGRPQRKPAGWRADYREFQSTICRANISLVCAASRAASTCGSSCRRSTSTSTLEPSTFRVAIPPGTAADHARRTARQRAARAMTPPTRVPVRVRACAKINLTLRVLGIRPDGYHELRTTFQSLALHDTLTFEPAPRSVCDHDDDPPVRPIARIWSGSAAAAAVARGGRRGGMSRRPGARSASGSRSRPAWAAAAATLPRRSGRCARSGKCASTTIR